MRPFLPLITATLLCGAALHFPSLAEPPKERAAASKDVTASQVNGTWRCRKNTIKVWALGGGKLQVDVDCIFEYKSSAYGPMANLGQAAGTAKIEGDTAVFIPTDDEKDGKITMRFVGGKMIVEQTGTCGFGHRVYATGTYEKVSAKKPKFGE